MDLNDVANALAEKLDAIPGLRPFSEVPQKITPPAAIISMGAGGFDDFQDDISVQFKVLVLVSASNVKGAQKALRDFCSGTGTMSIKAAIEADTDELTLAGVAVASNPHVEGWAEPETYNVGGTDYTGLEFTVDIIE